MSGLLDCRCQVCAALCDGDQSVQAGRVCACKEPELQMVNAPTVFWSGWICRRCFRVAASGDMTERTMELAILAATMDPRGEAI